MTIYHNFMLRPVVKKEKIKGGRKVQVVGYIPLAKRISDMVACGIRLKQAREELFDIPASSEVDDDEIQLDPTRSPGFDMADASVMARDLKARIKSARGQKTASGEVSGSKETKSAEQTASVRKPEGLEEAKSKYNATSEPSLSASRPSS